MSANSCSLQTCTPKPLGCIVSPPTRCVYYSGPTIAYMNVYPGNNLDMVIAAIANYIGSISGIPVMVDTYADMIAAATGTAYKRFLVLVDESKGGSERIVYDYWPGIGTIWIVTVDDQII